MRVIKFRAKTVITGEIVKSMTIAKGTIKRKSDKYFFEIAPNKYVGVVTETIGQFTGFTDKNNNEIFEGDLLTDVVETDEGKVDSKQKVFWNAPTGSWHLDNSFKQDKGCSSELWIELNDFEYKVLGNVYENVDLIAQS